MHPLLENAELTTDLDCQFYDLLNVGALIPVPPPLVSTDDPRLSDARNPLPESVTDASVSDIAGIVQSKLDLNGSIPPDWLGTTSDTAAQGNLAEYLFNKAYPNGYASLDGTGKIPAAQLPLGIGTGTVTSIGLTMPTQFAVTGSPVTASGVIAVNWTNITGSSWFGNSSATSLPPTFNTGLLPVSLMPSLDASKVTSGVLDPARLPVAVGVGATHMPGAAPDPGVTGNVFDYLARDMTYKPIPSFGPGYQPVVPSPQLEISTGPEPYIVSIISTQLDGVSLFYSVNNPNAGFLPVPDTGEIILYTGQVVYAYGAKAGYTNSDMVVMPAPSADPYSFVVTGDILNPTEIVTGDDAQPVTVGP
jgi:hypothetical protein